MRRLHHPQSVEPWSRSHLYVELRLREESSGNACVVLIHRPTVRSERIRVGGPDEEGALRRLAQPRRGKHCGRSVSWSCIALFQPRCFHVLGDAACLKWVPSPFPPSQSAGAGVCSTLIPSYCCSAVCASWVASVDSRLVFDVDRERKWCSRDGPPRKMAPAIAPGCGGCRWLSSCMQQA